MPDEPLDRLATSLFDPLYRDYLLRDFFAKIVPGAAVCLPSYVVLTGATPGALAGLGIGPSLLVAGFCWVVGFALQYLAEKLRILRHQPPGYSDRTVRYRTRIAFKKMATPSELIRVERYAVIKEATGNMSMALVLVVLGVSAFKWKEVLSTPERAISYAGVMLCIAWLLKRASWQHAVKQYSYMNQALSEQDKLQEGLSTPAQI